MAEKHIVVQGAVCKCQFGQLVDKIKVLSHKKHYANDKDASKKLIVTTNEIGGATLEKNTFGNCPKMGTNPPPPCKPVITEWKNFYEKVTLSNGGNVILEDSKAVCAIAGTSCIEIIDHGQRTQASKQNFKNANAAVHKQINPLVSPKEMYEPQPQHEDIANGVNGEEKEVAKCTIYFDKPNNYQNDFGFDSYELSKKGCKNKEKLKNEYTKYTIRDKEYLTPWVSIREGQTIKLAAKVKGKLNGEKISIQSPYFSFSPEEITEKTREIKITCNETFTSDHIVEAKVREEVVGAIHFMENEVKKISVQPIYVIDDTTDWGKIEKYTKNELLQQYFLRAFSSPLIEVSIKDPFKLSLLESNYSKSPSLGKIEDIIKEIKEKHLNLTNKITIVNKDIRPNLIKSLNDLYVISNENRHFLDIPLFFTPFECIIPNGEIDNFNNGFASGNSAILMFLGNDNKQPKVEIPHEIMHLLGLKHSF